LIRSDRLLVKERSDSAVVSDDKYDGVLIVLRVRQESEINSARPRSLRGQGVRCRPTAFDHSSRRVGRTGGLQDSVERPYVLHQAPSQPLIPTDPIDIDRVGLRRVNTHVKGDVLTFVDA